MRILALVASALVIGGCVAGTGTGGGAPASPTSPASPTTPSVTPPAPVDPQAAAVGDLIVALATKSIGPAGGAVAALLLPWLWKRLTGQANPPANKA